VRLSGRVVPDIGLFLHFHHQYLPGLIATTLVARFATKAAEADNE